MTTSPAPTSAPSSPPSADYIQVLDLLREVLTERKRARRMTPDAVHSLPSLMESVGALCTAVMNKTTESIRAEAVQVMVMAMRVAQEGDRALNLYRVRNGLPPHPPEPVVKGLEAVKPVAGATSSTSSATASPSAQVNPHKSGMAPDECLAEERPRRAPGVLQMVWHKTGEGMWRGYSAHDLDTTVAVISERAGQFLLSAAFTPDHQPSGTIYHNWSEAVDAAMKSFRAWLAPLLA